MNAARIEMLKKYISEEPNDPFNHYALACEYLEMNGEQAMTLLQNVVKEFPDYLPSYYQLASVLIEFELEENALEIFEKGIALAMKQKDIKALKELKSAHQNLLFEME